VNRISLKQIELVSSSVSDGNYGGAAVSEWVQGTAYAVGEIVSYTDHYVYQAKYAIDGSPSDAAPPDDKSVWALVGVLDRWAMFAPIVNRQTIAETIDVTVDASGTDCVGIFNVEALSVTFELYRGAELKKSETISLLRPPSSAGWYDWLFEEYSVQSKLLWQYPKYQTSTLRVTFASFDGNNAACGFCAPGVVQYLAKTQIRAAATLIDYSYVAFSRGLVIIEEGSSADDLSIDLVVETERIGQVREVLLREAGHAAIYDASDTGDPDLIVLALYKRFERVYSVRGWTRCNLSLNGLV
jgi:hypothetical protein